MGLFNRKPKPGLTPAQVELARRITFGLLTAQRRMANHINSRIRQIPVRVQIGLLIGFGLAFGIYCAYLLLRVFF